MFIKYSKSKYKVFNGKNQRTQKLMNIVDEKANRKKGKQSRCYSKLEDRNSKKSFSSSQSEYNNIFS